VSTFDPPTSRATLRDLRLITDHGGLSGADLFRGELLNGTRVVVKRSTHGRDVFQRLLGHAESLELALWSDGVFDRLPRGVSSPTIGGWVDGTDTWIVMRDLDGFVVGPDHAFDESEVERLLASLTALHSSGIRPNATTPLDRVVGMFSRTRLDAVDAPAALKASVARGWSLFRELGGSALADRVVPLADDPSPLVSALAARPAGFCHGDVAGVNMAWDGDGVALLDWGQAFIGPPALDIARFLPSGLRTSVVANDELLAAYQSRRGAEFDGVGLELSLLAAFVWYGWQKAIDASETADLALKRAELEGIRWWCERLPRALAHLHD